MSANTQNADLGFKGLLLSIKSFNALEGAERAFDLVQRMPLIPPWKNRLPRPRYVASLPAKPWTLCQLQFLPLNQSN